VCGECLDIECDRVSPQPSAVPSISDLPSVVPSSCGNFDISSCSSYSNRWLFDIASSCDDDDNCRCENAAALIECGGIQCPVNNYDEICPDDCPVCGECLDIECDRVSPQPSAVPSISHIPDITTYRSNEPTVVPSFFPVEYVCGCSLCSLSLNELTKNNISCYDRYRRLKIKFPGKKEKKICEKIYDKYDNCFPSCDPKIC